MSNTTWRRGTVNPRMIYRNDERGSVVAVARAVEDVPLIAAAPNLLAVAEDLKKYLDFVAGGLTTNSTVEYELYHRLGAAIRAAKGTDQ